MSFAIGAALLASGCANLSTVFRDFELEKGRSITVDAQQRAILVNKVRDENGELRTVYCSEPSPDSLFAIGASFGGGASAGLASGAKGDAEVAQALVSAASDALSARNATIQLLRDGLYRACEAYASGALSRQEYAEVTWRYQKMVLAALSIELVSNLNRPRREPSVTGANGGAGGKAGADRDFPAAGATAAAGNGDQKSSPADVKTIVSAFQAGAAAAKSPAPQAPPYSDAAIERISETAVFLVSAVLQSEDRVAQCLRYLSITAQSDRERKAVDSAIDRLCTKLIEGSIVIAPSSRSSLPLH
jgi:hypothetical protein